MSKVDYVPSVKMTREYSPIYVINLNFIQNEANVKRTIAESIESVMEMYFQR